MVARIFVGALAIGIVCSVAVTEARVTRIEILKVEPAPFTAAANAGPFEKITGNAYGELDPRDAKNALITDIQFAPRHARGMPENIQYPLLDYALGPAFTYQDQSGYWTKAPTVKQVLPQLVPRVDADGNEMAGVKSPLQMAPLGTYTGWNVMSSGVFKGQMCLFASPVGGFIPFSKTKAERLSSGDPRLSLEERYQTHDGYVQAVSAAARTQAKEGYLRQVDADTMIKQTEASMVLHSDAALDFSGKIIDNWSHHDDQPPRLHENGHHRPGGRRHPPRRAGTEES